MRILLHSFLAVGLALGLLVLPTAAMATDQAQTPQRIELNNGHSVFFTRLAVIQGQPGEAQDLVVNRAAQVLEAFTAKTQLEGCGDITIGPGDVFRIVVGTIGAHIGCVTDTTPLHGYVSTGMTIHSHPTRRMFIVNVADVASNSVADSVYQELHVGRSMAAGVHGETFSATDLRAPMSYLVSNGRLLYQARGKVYDRGPVDQLPVGAPFTDVASLGR
jgi:hypothetical protein